MASILVISGNPFVVHYCCTVLSEVHVLKTINNGTEALADIAAFNYDLVIIDDNLPGVCLKEFFWKINRMDPETPILVLSSEVETERKFIRYDGIFSCLPKPFTGRALKEKIGEYFVRSSN